MAGLDRLVIHFYLKIHNSPFLIHFRPPNLPTTSNWCPAGMTHESAWLEQSRQRSGWSHPRRFREERWACVMLCPPCLTISSILDSRCTFILNIRLAIDLAVCMVSGYWMAPSCNLVLLQILNCALPSWYNQFKMLTFKTCVSVLPILLHTYTSLIPCVSPHAIIFLTAAYSFHFPKTL